MVNRTGDQCKNIAVHNLFLQKSNIIYKQLIKTYYALEGASIKVQFAKKTLLVASIQASMFKLTLDISSMRHFM